MRFSASLDLAPVEELLSSTLERTVRIIRTGRLSGGDINVALKLTLDDGSHVFMKMNEEENASFFRAETQGLAAIAGSGAIGTPRVLGRTQKGGPGGYSCLLLTVVSEKKRIPGDFETFGRELAAMHRADTTALVPGGGFGFFCDNYIGAGVQYNKPHKSWITFFRDRRLMPQIEATAGYFTAEERKRAVSLLDHIGDFLVEPERPSLLHGDLWAGNVITGDDGKAWLIDPAVYVGHAEADLAMTELFGGFAPEFYHAYREAAPLQPGYEHRRDLYNLYHLLNHLHLFGHAYLPAVKRVMEKYGKMI